LQVVRQLGPGVLALKAQHRGIATLRPLDQGSGHIRARAVAWDDVKFFICGIAVKRDDFVAPRFLGFGSPLFVLHKADTLVQATCEGVVKRNFEECVGHLPFADILTQQVKRVEVAVVRGDDNHLTTPHEQGQSGLEDLGQRIVERGLINNDHTLTPAQGTGARGQGHNLKTAGKHDAEGQNIVRAAVRLGIFKQGLADLGRRQPVGFGPHGADVDKLAGHVQTVADVEHVHAASRSRRTGVEGCTGANTPGKPDAARFFDNHDLVCINCRHSGLLMWQEDDG